MQTTTGLEIAIIGMAGRFPGAGNVEQYWRNIAAGIESVRPLRPDELAAAGVSEAQLANPENVNAGAFLEEIEYFDAGLFAYAAKEAQLMDPQHRLFLETAWEALEHAGCAPDQFEGQIGVFAGAPGSSYLLETVAKNAAALRQVALSDLMYENTHDLLATRVSYKLNLRGPSITLGTACSTSLVLLHYACQSLLAGDCDVALAGGARVSVPHKSIYSYAEGGILSRDGHCRSFDAKASGTISSNGVGVLVLKRLEDALRDGDTVHAIIKGTAVNNDGAQKVGFTAPSVAGQAEVIQKALAAADVEAESISYIEAHGTATHLGDPIELAGLSKAYRQHTQKTGFCAIGSVKANIGHTDTAAGVAGVIKVVQMLKHAVLPPAVNFETPNPEINFPATPFYVNQQRQVWAAPLRRAGVSAFGIGGTNAHAILEAAEPAGPGSASRELQLLCFSGKTRAALEANIAHFRSWLEHHDDSVFADAAYTLKTGRVSLEYRSAVLCRDRADALAKLGQALPGNYSRVQDRALVFMFSGQGAQYHNMMRGLYQAEAVFRASVDASAAILLPLLGQDIRDVVFLDAAAQDEGKAALLQRTRYTQPALFVFEYALAQLLSSWGLQAKAAIGHSIGEYVAACLAGVFSLPDALKLVAARAAAMDDMPGGAMLAVGLSESEVEAYRIAGVSLAAVNAPNMVVLAGPHESIQAVQAALQQAPGNPISNRLLHTSHAFHSDMMQGCLDVFAQAFEGVTLNAPTAPFISSLSGDWITAAQATSPAYWLAQLRQPVRFADGVAKILSDANHVLLEVGPGRSLAALVEQQLAPNQRGQVLACVREVKRQASDEAVLYGVLGQLWALGVRVNWRGFYQAEQRRKIVLPSYAFQRQKYWLEPVAAATAATAAADQAAQATPDGARKALPDWFYQHVWQQAALPVSAQTGASAGKNWLVFDDEHGVSAALKAGLQAAGHTVVEVKSGSGFRMPGGKNPRSAQVTPGQGADFKKLFACLKQENLWPQHIVYCGAIQDLPKSDAAVSYAQFESLLSIAREYSLLGADAECQFALVLNHLAEVCGSAIDPAKSLLSGACRVIPKEYSQIHCSTIDIVLPAKGLFGRAGKFDAEALLRELQRAPQHGAAPVVALRGRSRLVQSVQAVPLHESAPAPCFRQQGVYLISGGFGGIGASIARHLASQYQARLILTSRGETPAPEAWEAWLASHDVSNDKSQRIRLLQELIKLGAKVEVICADVSDAAAMQAGLQRAEAVLGKVQGVIHSAGIADGALIQRRTAADSAKVFASKVIGTQNLQRLFAQHQLDCFVLCSSLASEIAPVGQAAYCAANAYQDAFAQARAAQGGATRYLAIGWDSWQEVGMAVNSLGADKLHYIHHGIMPEEGVQALQLALNSGLSHCYTSTRGLPLPTARQSEAAPAAASDGTDAVKPDAAAESASQFHPRPDLSVAYLAPRNEIEASICAIWQDKIGVAPLGVHDDFFELNGHSLMAVQIITEIKRKLHVSLPAGSIYDNSTIAQLAQSLAARMPKTPAVEEN
ncbi:SDR family NAD(P)-dependent oxidoreductase [Massilia sp. W12]|uniref:type I polyketide synthase n=1 Tax=Massilia sp. W12 TaxID=3126507 RepID=UPI0030CAB327